MKIFPKPFVFLLCVLPWLASVVVLAWLLDQRFPLSGERYFSFPLDGRSAWFDPFLPWDRATTYGVKPEGWIGQRIVGDPVYAGIRRPGIFDRVQVTLETRAFKQPLMEIGILRDAKTFAFENVPVWSERLASGWRRVEQGGRRGFVRDGFPDAALESNDLSTLMVWHASPTFMWQMDPAAVERRFDVALRGNVDIYALPAGGELFFRFLLQDTRSDVSVTTTKSHPLAVLRVMRGNELLWSEVVETNGKMKGNAGRMFEKIVRLNDMPPAVYRVSLSGSDDLSVRAINTTASHWVVGPRIFFDDAAGYRNVQRPARVWTNSQHLVVEASHSEGLQTIALGNSRVDVARARQTYPLDRRTDERDGARLLSVPLGDVRVVGDGYFAFSEDALFLPSPRRLTDASDPAAEGVRAVMTNYQSPERTEDGWLKLRASFSLPKDEERSKLILAAPGLEFRGGAVDVRRVSLSYRRPPLTWELLKPLLMEEGKMIWRRLQRL